MTFQQLLTDEVYSFFLVFCRIGSCVMMLPAFGSSYIPPRSRLFMALAFSLIMTPLVTNIPPMPANSIKLAGYVISEMLIGILIGSIAKVLGSAIHVGGMIISMQSSLAQASLFDPNQGSQSSVFGTFLDMMVMVLIFTTGIQHVMIIAMADSYTYFAPVSPIPFGDFSELMVKTVSKAFLIGFQLAMPMIIVGTLVNLASGLLARLMPAFQVYFVIMPAQILIAVFVFMTTFSAGLMWYMGIFGDAMNNLFK